MGIFRETCQRAEMLRLDCINNRQSISMQSSRRKGNQLGLLVSTGYLHGQRSIKAKSNFLKWI